MDHYLEVIEAAKECPSGNLTVILQIEFQNNVRGAVFMDAESDELYTRKYRSVDDPRNLKVDLSAFYRLKEASKQIKVC
jgi:hypothetical protein